MAKIVFYPFFMLRIIIVDDEYTIRHGLSAFFPWEELGFTVSGTFSNATDALSFIKENKIDVVLSDIKMPGKDGLEMIREMLLINPALKCVVISGYKDFEYAKKCIDLGVSNYIVKPTKYEELKQIFAKLSEELSQKEQEDKPIIPSDIESIKEYINKNLKDVTLESVAEFANLNPYYFSTFFHQQSGEKFYNYVLKLKMEKAKKLLENSPLSIQDISAVIGYSNSNSFARTFRLFYGTSPSSFRFNSVRNNENG